MKVLYIAGKFSDKDKLHGIVYNINQASKIALEAWNKGWCVICPHKNTANFQHSEIKDEVWYQGGIELSSRCDAILAISDCNESKGVYYELEYADNHDIPIHYYFIDGIPDPDGGKE